MYVNCSTTGAAETLEDHFEPLQIIRKDDNALTKHTKGNGRTVEYEGMQTISGGRGIKKQKGRDTLVSVLRRKLRNTRKRQRYGADQENTSTEKRIPVPIIKLEEPTEK